MKDTVVLKGEKRLADSHSNCEEHQPCLPKSDGSSPTTDSEGSHDLPDTTAEAPDGGWGWFIVLAVFVGNLLIDGVLGSFGLLYPELVTEFAAGPAVTSMAGSMAAGTYLFTSLLWGGCIRMYGCRVICFAGGCICAVGFALSMLSQNILTFILTYGVLGGIGFGMNSISGHIIVNSYFDKKRGIAQGIVSSGAGVGLFLTAPLKQYTLSEYGWRGTVLIFAGVVAHFCVCACLMRPFDSNRNKPVASEKTNSEEISVDTNANDMQFDSTDKKVDQTPDEYEIISVDTGQFRNSRTEYHRHSSEVCDDNPSSELYKQKAKSEICDVYAACDQAVPHSFRKHINPNSLNLKTELGRNYPNMFHEPDLQRILRRKGYTDKHKDLHANDFGLSGNVCNAFSLPNLAKYQSLNDMNVRKSVENFSSQYFDPFKRKDILFSGSIHHLSEFQVAKDMNSFVRSMTLCEEKDMPRTNHTHDDGPRSDTCIYALKMVLQHLCDFSVFRDKIFIPLLIGAMFIQMSQFIPNTFIAEYGYSVNLGETQISVIVAVYGVSNIFGRLSAGCLANVSCISPLWLCNFGTAMCGVACALFPMCQSFWTLIIFATCQGYFIGYFPPLQILILVHYLGLDKLTSSVGFLQMAKGPAAIVGPPLAGLVYEWTRSYGTAVQFAGVLSLIAAAVQSLAALLNHCSARSAHDNMKSLEVVIEV